MSLLSHPASRFHPILSGACLLMGHADESAALLADPEPTGVELADALAAIDDDRATQQADDVAAAEMRQTIRVARDRFGVSANVRLSRSLTVDAAAGTSSDYTAVLFPAGGTDAILGGGVSPLAALDDVTRQIDRRFVHEFGGFRLPNVALIIGGHYRSTSDALAFARRIAVDVSYLDVLIQHHNEGVVELRDEPPMAPALAIAAA